MIESNVVKNEIISLICKLANEAGGVPPGQRKFATETGIKDHVWRGKIWVKWTDALAEAGFDSLKWIEKFDDEFLLTKLGDLAVRLGHFPSQSELRYESANNSNFPSTTAFKKRWGMSQIAEELARYAAKFENATVSRLATDYLQAKPVKEVLKAEFTNAAAKGHVYLQKVDKRFRIGKTNSLVGRYRQVQLETPHKVEYVHTILTDDPDGVEKYWHKRFEPLRLQISGDWFVLKPTDIAAFKRWKKIW
jgi:Meiotically up-regulated gene 113